jgi:DNA-binding NtrC family response regulator
MASGLGASDAVRHPALVPPTDGEVMSSSLADGVRTDRRRLAVLLQGAALLGHLEHASWHLASGWSTAWVDGEGMLRVRGARPGPAAELPQELLRQLLARLFAAAGGSEPISGRGTARRAARALQRRWWQALAALAPDTAVGHILEEADFLWEPIHSTARRALVAEHRRGGAAHLWVAGPGSARRAFLRRAGDLAALAETLAAADARAQWYSGGEGGEPAAALAAAGRWRAAVAAWQRQPPRQDGERLALAQCWFGLGRFERALAEVQGLPEDLPAAAALRAACLLYVGRLRAARRATAQAAGCDAATGLEIADVAVRALANGGDLAAARSCAAAARAACRRRPAALRARAGLLAAQAAWDGADLEGLERSLEEARRLDPTVVETWGWSQIHALAELERGAAPRAVALLSAALARDRRRLRRFEAAGLWNDLGVARARSGELAGAERAFLHALRLHQGCDGTRATTLGLANLAEVRLRRGRLLGCEEILRATSAANRAAGNVRGTVSDLLLWARLELVQGRAEAALGFVAAAEELAERHGLASLRGEARVLRARALGWQDRVAAAAAELDRVTVADLHHLEPEERPGLFALAGRLREAARLAAEVGAWGRPWTAALAGGGEVPADAWPHDPSLEAYRQARLVADLERFAPGSVPASRRRRAIATFRGLGAARAAGPLEVREHGPWHALAMHLGESGDGPGHLPHLFGDAGYAAARVWWEGPGDARVLVAGEGGGEELSAPAGAGRLVLRAAAVDPPLRALFRLVLTEWVGRPASRETGSPAAEPPAGVEVAPGIVGTSPALGQAVARAVRLAGGSLPLLVLGESGTGKELVARLIHGRSPRRERPLLAVNCAALAESLVLSDLFGHVRGAFTGADRDRAGVFEAADGGTVLLDEIGDLPGSAQGMLLRVLQEGEVRRLGESRTRRVDVRVVAATHRDLGRMVRDGGFRQDLYYRLKGAIIELPPLRERGGDVLLLADHLLAAGSAGHPPVLCGPARSRLLAHPWPGNVRELDNVLAAAAALAGGAGATILPEHLDLPAPGSDVRAAGDYHARVHSFRRLLVTEALEAAGGVQAEAARRLGLSRQALHYLVRQLGVE